MSRLVLLAAGALALGGCFVDPPQSAEPYYAQVVGGAPFTGLVVEVDHAPGYRPSEEAIAHLVATLKNVTSKQTVAVVVGEELSGAADATWTSEELVQLEIDTRDTAHAAPTAVLHVLYPAGAFEREGVAGVTVSGPVIGPVVVFLDALREVGTPLAPLPNPQPAVTVLERSTLLHEAGHAMGLVNNGLDQVRDREDKEHAGHSSNPRSVMYWRVETVNGLREILLRDGAVPDRFDADDLADLRSAGGR